MPVLGKGTGDSSSRMTVARTAQPQWARQLIETLASAQRQFSPDNATAVVEVMDHLPSVLEAMGKFCRNVGARSVDAVDLPPAAQEVFLNIGNMQMKAAGPVDRALQAAKRTVMDRIARMQAQRAKDKAWDVSRNPPK